MKNKLAFILIAFMAITLIACSDDDDSASSDTKIKALIDNTGGGLSLEGKATITVPEKSIAETRTIEMTNSVTVPQGNDLNLVPLSDAINCHPDGTFFDPDNPARLTINYDKAKFEKLGLKPEDMRIFYYDEESESHVAIDGVVNEDAGTVSTDIYHFSTYTAMAIANMTDSSQAPPYVGGPSYVPSAVVNEAFKVRFLIYDHRLEPYDDKNAIARVEAYWSVNDGEQHYVGKMSRCMNTDSSANDRYEFEIPSGSITRPNDVLDITITAYDNMGLNTFRKYTKTNFGRITSFTTDPADLRITGGYQKRYRVRAQIQNGNPIWIYPESWTIEPSDLGFFSGNYFTGSQSGTGTITPEFVTNRNPVKGNVKVDVGQIEQVRIIGESGQLLDHDAVLGVCKPEVYNFDAVGLDEYGNRIAIYPDWSKSGVIGSITTLGASAGKLETSEAQVGATGDVCITLGGMYACVHVNVCTGEEVVVTDAEGLQSAPDLDYNGENKFAVVWQNMVPYANPQCTELSILSGIETSYTLGDILFKEISHSGDTTNTKLIHQSSIEEETQTDRIIKHSVGYYKPNIKHGTNKYAIVSSKYDVNMYCSTDSSGAVQDPDYNTELIFTSLDEDLNVETSFSLVNLASSGNPQLSQSSAIDFDGEAYGILGIKRILIDDVGYYKLIYTRVKENDNQIIVNPKDIIQENIGTGVTFMGHEVAKDILFDIAYNKEKNEYGIIWTELSQFAGANVIGIRFARIDVNGNLLNQPITVNTIDNIPGDYGISGSLAWNGDTWGICWWYYDSSNSKSKIYFTSIDDSDNINDEILITENDNTHEYFALMDWGSPLFAISFSETNSNESSLKFVTINTNNMELSNIIDIGEIKPTSNLLYDRSIRNLFSISTGGTSFGIAWTKYMNSINYDIAFKQICP